MDETAAGQGTELTLDLQITFEEAFRGTQARLPLPKQKAITLYVPPGVDTGTRMRLKGVLKPDRAGGARGDLYVKIIVREHPVFRREDYDLSCELPLMAEQRAAGGTFQAPAPEGPVPLVVPPGTSVGTVFSLPLGMPFLREDRRGTLRVTVVHPTGASTAGAPLWPPKESPRTESRGPGLGSKRVLPLIALAAALLALLTYLGTR